MFVSLFSWISPLFGISRCRLTSKWNVMASFGELLWFVNSSLGLYELHFRENFIVWWWIHCVISVSWAGVDAISGGCLLRLCVSLLLLNFVSFPGILFGLSWDACDDVLPRVEHATIAVSFINVFAGGIGVWLKRQCGNWLDGNDRHYCRFCCPCRNQQDREWR